MFKKLIYTRRCGSVSIKVTRLYIGALLVLLVINLSKTLE